MDTQKHLFDNRKLAVLLIPLAIDQLLNSFMGTVDTLVVSNLGSAAISAVTLVDSINILIVQAFFALASGGTVVCSHYLGCKKREHAKEAARQLIFITFCLSVMIGAICLIFNGQILGLIFGEVEESVMINAKKYFFFSAISYPTFCLSVMIGAICLIFNGQILGLIFGEVEESVMINAKKYFFFSAISYPFIALYDDGSCILRAQENSSLPMKISICSNIVNIVLNVWFVWGLHLGVYFKSPGKQQSADENFNLFQYCEHCIECMVCMGTSSWGGRFCMRDDACENVCNDRCDVPTAETRAGNSGV